MKATKLVTGILCAIAACFIIAGGIKDAGWFNKKPVTPTPPATAQIQIVENV